MSADEVFVGELIDAVRDERGFESVVIVRVKERFLGNGPETQPVRVAANVCSRLGGPAGNEFLIFANHEERGELVEKACATVPNEAGEAEQDIRTLRRRAWLWRIQRRIAKAWRSHADR